MGKKTFYSKPKQQIIHCVENQKGIKPIILSLILWAYKTN